MSAPTISAQRVTSSVETKPCLANAALSVWRRTSANGLGKDLPGLFMPQGSARSRGHDASSWSGAAKARVARRGGARRGSPRLVRPSSPRASLARRAGRAGRSLSRVALRNHAAADDHQGGRAVLRAVYCTLAERARPRGGAARRCAQTLGGPWLLRARAPSVRLRQGRGRTARRILSAKRD